MDSTTYIEACKSWEVDASNYIFGHAIYMQNAIILCVNIGVEPKFMSIDSVCRANMHYSLQRFMQTVRVGFGRESAARGDPGSTTRSVASHTS